MKIAIATGIFIITLSFLWFTSKTPDPVSSPEMEKAANVFLQAGQEFIETSPSASSSPSPTLSSPPTNTPTASPLSTLTPLAPQPTSAPTTYPTVTPMPEITPTPTSTQTPTPTPPPSSLHTWYTSSYRTAKYYYCDTDATWKTLSPEYLKSYPSAEALLADYSRTLHAPCQ